MAIDFNNLLSAATQTDFIGNNTYRSGNITGTFASTPPTFNYNTNSVSPIKVIWRFSA